MPKALKRTISLVLAAALMAGFLPSNIAPEHTALGAGYSFEDVRPSDYYYKAVSRFASLNPPVVLGSMRGDGKWYFSPDGTLTRAQFAAMYTRLFNCDVTVPLSFSDVKTSDWFYNDVAKAYAAGLMQGVSADKFMPNQGIERQEVVTVLGRSLGLNKKDSSSLFSAFSDADQISDFARGYISAMIGHGWWLDGENKGTFRPRDYITRAEAVYFLYNLYNNIPESTSNYNNKTVTGNLLVRSAGGEMINVTVNGDVILADGLLDGNFAFRNSRINGRLVIRGGGPNSVNLSGTRITQGVWVYNPNGVTRLRNTNDTVRTGVITALTDVILDGQGFASLIVPENATGGSIFTPQNAYLDSVITEKPESQFVLNNASVDNFTVQTDADGVSVALDADSAISHLEIFGANFRLTGGRVGEIVVTQNGGVLDNIDEHFTLAELPPGISVTINGKLYSGPPTNEDGRPSTFARDEENGVTRDRVKTGGGTLTLTNTPQSGYHLVTIEQDQKTTIGLTERGRLAYWLGFFVPVPENYQNPVVKVGYNFESSRATPTSDAVYSVPVTRQDNQDGILIYIPVSLNELKEASVNQTVSIVWGDATYEKITFRGNPLKVAAPTAKEEAKLVAQFANALFFAYDNLHVYSGSAALDRLLYSDNPLGLDLRGLGTLPNVSSLDENGESNGDYTYPQFLAEMNDERDGMLNRQAIQDFITAKTNYVGALYAINHATSAQETFGILTRKDYAAQLLIQITSVSNWGRLTAGGRQYVAAELLKARPTTGYKDEPAVKKKFDDLVAKRLESETKLLLAINSAGSGPDEKKITGNAANQVILGIAGEPYASAEESKKDEMAQGLRDKQPWPNLQAVIDYLDPSDGKYTPPYVEPDDNTKIVSVEIPAAFPDLVVGKDMMIIPTIMTTSGAQSLGKVMDSIKLTTTYSPVNCATVEMTPQGIHVVGAIKGTLKIQVTSTVDNKKTSKNVSVKIVDYVPVTSMKLNLPTVDISVGGRENLRLVDILPTNFNSTFTWYSDNPDVATISGSGSTAYVTGVKPGFTTVFALSDSKVKAECKVFVGSDEPMVLIENASPIFVGIDCRETINARMSPINVSNRTLIYESQDTTTVSIYNPLTGTIMGLREGTAQIKVYSAANPTVFATIEVVVDKDMHGVYLSEDGPVTLYVGGYKPMFAEVFPESTADKTLSWDIKGNAGVIKVDNSGKVTAIGAGKATLVVSLVSDPRATDTCEFVVTNEKLTVTATTKSLTGNNAIPLYGYSDKIELKFSPDIKNPEIDYESDKPSVATVSPDGYIYGASVGATTIYAIPRINGQRIPIKVEVKYVAVQDFIVTPPTPDEAHPYKMSIGQVTTPGTNGLDITFYPENASDKRIVFRSMADSYVTAIGDDLGALEARKTTWWNEDVTDPVTGSVTSVYKDHPVQVYITAKGITDPKKSQKMIWVSVEDTVYNKLTDIKIKMVDWVIPVGSKRQLVPEFTGADPTQRPSNTAVMWTTSNPAVLDISQSGLITALSPGRATVTVSSTETVISSTLDVVVAPIAVSAVEYPGTETGNGMYYLIRGRSTKIDFAPILGPATATNRDINWVSSDPTAVSYSSSEKKITAQKDGVVAVMTGTLAKPFGYGSKAPKDMTRAKNGELEQSGITYDPVSDTYSDPNGNALDPDKVIPCVVLNNTVFSVPVVVWAEAVTSVARLNSTPMNYGKVNSVSFRIYPTNASMTSLTWTADGVPITQDNISNTFSGETPNSTVRYTPTDNTKDFVHFVCTVTLTNYQISLDADKTVDDIARQWPSTEKAGVKVFEFDVPVTNLAPASLALSIPGVDGDLYADGTGAPATLAAAAIVGPVGVSDGSVKYSVASDSRDIAKIDAKTGKLTLLGGSGDLTVNAQSAVNPAIKDSVTIHVKPAPAPASITLDDMEVTAGTGSVAVAARVFFSSGLSEYAKTKLVWRTSRNGIIRLYTGRGNTAESVVIFDALAPGTVVLTATSAVDGTVFGSCVITVEPQTGEEDILEPIGLVLPVGFSSPLTLPDLVGADSDDAIAAARFSSENPAVVSVAANGKLTAVANGECVLTAEYNGQKRYIRAVVGGKSATRLRLRSNAKVVLGENLSLYPDITPYDATAFIWSSADSNVAAVSDNGVVTGRSSGRVAITIRSADGKLTSRCFVTVTDVPAQRVSGVKLNAASRDIQKGAYFDLAATVSPAKAGNSGVSFYSSDPAVARVDVYGRVYGLKGGKATVYAVTDDGGFTVSCAVNVIARAAEITAPSAITIKQGAKKQIAVTVTPDDASNTVPKFTSSDEKTAAVTPDGWVTAKAKGTATITIRLDGKTVKCVVTVE